MTVDVMIVVMADATIAELVAALEADARTLV